MDEGEGDVLLDQSGQAHHAANEGGTWGSESAEVVWDYSGTPRLVDVPVMALAHLCIPLEAEWNLDGQPWLGTCFPSDAETCSEDLDGDGLVTVADLLMVLGAFGQACSD